MRDFHLAELARLLGRARLARWLAENREQLAAELASDARSAPAFERVRVCVPTRPACRAR